MRPYKIALGRKWTDTSGWPTQLQIDGRTCIPEGRYRVRPTRNSKFYEQYQKDPSLKLKYVLTLEDVPGLATDMDRDFNFKVGRSREALKRIHRILDPFFVEGEMDFGVEVWWEIRRSGLLA